jgi:outer membrane protein assembly factor BamD (BamD/ComL family)
MSSNLTNFLGGTLAALAVFASPAARAQEAAAEGEENKVDEALKAEISYVEALVDNGFPDLAETVIAATKKKWPESDAMFFAIEIRGMLSLGKFDDAEKRIAALPDRNGSKFWAARLEIANNYFKHGKKAECSAIYDEFFKKFAKPPKELREFYLQACYAWGQILVGDKRFEEAAKVYEGLLGMLNKKTNDDDANTWCNVACETADMYLYLATSRSKPAERKPYLDSAKKLVDQLLWEQGRPVYFGRAIAMKANIELLKGDVAKAQATIDDYMDQLVELHKAIEEFDPEGKVGLLRQSPMPLCRYMLADMLWKEAKAEFKKPKRNDERIKSLLFGEKGKNGKRNGAGAFNHSLNVFIKYPESTWASQAGDMSEEIRKFAEDTYGAKIKTTITEEQRQKVRAMQFRSADEKFASGEYAEAIADYAQALAQYPEGRESIRAIENTATSFLNLIARNKGDKAKVDGWRIDADAVEGYIAERFGGHRDRAVMTDAGDAVLRLAALEKQRGEVSRADRLYKEFLLNYRRHANASLMAASIAGEAQRAGRFADAAALYEIICRNYTNSVHYATALVNLAVCHEKLGDRKSAIECLGVYVATEKSRLKRTQAQMQLAMLYQKDGLDTFKSAETNETPEAVSKQFGAGSAQIVRGIKQFLEFAATCEKALADPGVPAVEKKQYGELREAALYLAGDCWGRITKPEGKLEECRRKSAEALEAYVKQYPKGKYAKAAYVKLGTIYTALGDLAGSKDALDRLSKAFPDSDEAKNAMPRLAKNLIEMGLAKEGTEIYANMLRTDGAYTAQQFVNAGEALITAKSWDLADQAFEKAIAKAGTNQVTTVAKARIGQANALFRQKSYAEARSQLDLFLSDEKMSKLPIAADANLLLVEVASEQGRLEKNDQIRRKNFNAAVGAVKKLRAYWRSKPKHEQDAVDLMSADIVVRRMQAEDAMGLEAQAKDSCQTAAQMFQTFLQSHGVDEAHPIDKMSAGELANLERCYATMVPLFSRLGREQADVVLKFGQEYLEYFPNGKARTEIINCINRAKASGVQAPVQEARPEAEQKPSEAAEPAPEKPETSQSETSQPENSQSETSQS